MMSVLNYITWDVSPWLYEGEHFAIGWYGTLWTLGLVEILVAFLTTFRSEQMPTNYALVSFMVTLVCVIFFGHLFQGLFYEWYYAPNNPVHCMGTDWHYRNHYFEHPQEFFIFTHGGFSSHGTVLGVIVAGWIMGKILHCDTWYVADRGMIGLCILGIAVRMGNFVNEEIYGIETTLPWGVIFGGNTVASHPTQIYEALLCLFAMLVALWLYRRKEGGQYRGLLSGVIVAIVMLLRIVIEFIKLPQMEIERNWYLNMGQILSIPFAIWGIWRIFYAIEKGKTIRKPLLPAPTRAEKRRAQKQR